jgi:anaerobic magnesium-protoporphyrin IX monomethyl ester cyclase
MESEHIMRIVIVNVPHPAIGSRIPDEHLPPLGLLCVGGPLIDDGHDVHLIDGELKPMTLPELQRAVIALKPDAVLFGHSGSSSAQPIISELAAMVRRQLAEVLIVYGGVHPTYHWQDILTQDMSVDIIVRGEGEATMQSLFRRLSASIAYDDLAGLAFRQNGAAHATPPATVIADLDAFRIGWELIDHAHYSYWGGKRAVVIQFSRGCPHLCNYCGQRGFWTRWRHRDPQKLAAEMAHLHRVHGVEVFNFADENPSAGRKPWKAFLEALIAENISVTLVGSTRADDIVRDADILHLYKKAGFERFLLGMENTDEATLKLIKKGGTVSADKEAIQLLRKHNILSMATWVAGFSDQTDADLWHGLKQLIAYDPDQIQALYVTPHRWTPFFRIAAERFIVQRDKTKWDYKHQVLAMENMPPWRLFMWVKFIELAAQLRPRALMRLIWNPEPKMRHAIRWYYRMGRRVWFHEVRGFLFRDNAKNSETTLQAFWGESLDAHEESMAVSRQPRALKKRPDVSVMPPLAPAGVIQGQEPFSSFPD